MGGIEWKGSEACSKGPGIFPGSYPRCSGQSAVYFWTGSLCVFGIDCAYDPSNGCIDALRTTGMRFHMSHSERKKDGRGEGLKDVRAHDIPERSSTRATASLFRQEGRKGLIVAKLIIQLGGIN